MNISVSGRHIEITDAIRDHVHTGLKKVREHFDRVIDVDVVLSVQKKNHNAEFNLHANGLRIHARENSDDMYASIDSAIQKLDRQVSKHKDKIQRHQPRTAKETREYRHNIFEISSDGTDGEQSETAPHTIIHREKLPLHPMSVDEAAFQLGLLDEHFLVFSNAHTDQVNVVYARDDGTYGLIEPQN